MLILKETTTEYWNLAAPSWNNFVLIVIPAGDTSFAWVFLYGCQYLKLHIQSGIDPFALGQIKAIVVGKFMESRHVECQGLLLLLAWNLLEECFNQNTKKSFYIQKN